MEVHHPNLLSQGDFFPGKPITIIDADQFTFWVSQFDNRRTAFSIEVATVVKTFH
jgi:hypothetical protein